MKSSPSREHATAANPAHGLCYGTSQVAIPAGELKVDDHRAKLVRGAVTINGQGKLEFEFTEPAR